MSECINGLKHLLFQFLKCCEIELQNNPRGLREPQRLARETNCMYFLLKCKMMNLFGGYYEFNNF
jgi:hypothetical protein